MEMRSQWEYFLNNVGVWSGSFITYTLEAREVSEIASCFHLEAFNDNCSARSNLQRENFPDLRLEFRKLPQNVLYHADGSYSQGNIKYAAYGDFACEFSLMNHDHRLRSQVLFDVAGYPGRIILMREYLAGTKKDQMIKMVKRYTVKDLLGKWEGFATTIYPDSRPSIQYPTHLHFYIDEYKRLAQESQFNGHKLYASAQTKDQLLTFDSDSQHIQNVVLLPGGVSVSFPAKLKMRKPVYLEMAWLVEPDVRHRITRYYNKFGEWKEVSFIIEKKVE